MNAVIRRSSPLGSVTMHARRRACAATGAALLTMMTLLPLANAFQITHLESAVKLIASVSG